MLDANNREAMFATMFAGMLDLTTGELTYCNCGHNPPLLLRAGRGTWLTGGNPPLAVASGHAFTTCTLAMVPGDRLLLYTDGVTEAHRADDSLFGEQRLTACAEAGGTLDGLIGRVMAAVDAFANGTPQFDDMACVALGYCGG